MLYTEKCLLEDSIGRQQIVSFPHPHPVASYLLWPMLRLPPSAFIVVMETDVGRSQNLSATISLSSAMLSKGRSCEMEQQDDLEALAS